MTIRPALPGDLDALEAIEAASYPIAEGASRESIAARLAVFPDCFWVLEEAGEIRAFICGMCSSRSDLTDDMYDTPAMHEAAGEWLMLFSVVTDPRYRSRGYAGSLMERVIRDAAAQGKRGIVLTCKQRLLGFYARFGYKNEGISASTHGDALWYQMRLTLSKGE